MKEGYREVYIQKFYNFDKIEQLKKSHKTPKVSQLSIKEELPGPHRYIGELYHTFKNANQLPIL